MKLPRRRFLRLAAGAAALPAVARSASAETYPSRSVRLLVGFAPGGGNDIVARLIAQWLSDRTGQQFSVENRPGAGTNIATEIVVKAPPDGYTLLLAGLPNATSASMFSQLNFNFIRDIAPVGAILRAPNVMLVNPAVPADTVPAFIAYAKTHPGKVNLASAGTGSETHLAGELFRMMAGVELVHVPYRGTGPALAALLAGQVDVQFPPTAASLEFIRAGRLRGLAVTGATRSAMLPELPTVGDFLPGYEIAGWYGVAAPRGTPTEIIDTLNREINGALADPKMTARFADLGGIPIGGTPGEFAKLIADETEKWSKVVLAANIKAD